MRTTLLRVSILCGIALAFTVPTHGEVVRMQIDERALFAEGHRFGHVGAYQRISGRFFYAVDPLHAANAHITDLKRAPRNSDGKVEFWADFFLMKPVDPAKGNGRLLYDVHNRGNKLALWTFNEGERTNDPTSLEHAGNDFLFEAGYTLLWTGWDGDVVGDDTHRLLAGLPVAVQEDGASITGPNYVEISVDEPTFSREFFWSQWGTAAAYPSVSLDNTSARLSMRRTRSEPATEIPHDAWTFARWEDGALVPDPTSVYIKEGFKPGWLYDLVYTARDPRVSGLGLLCIRDGVSFLRYAEADAEGTPNPLHDAIERAYCFGISQSGRLTHHFLYEGLNADLSGRRIFDGIISHVPGAGKGLFNSRFGMATVYGLPHRYNLYPVDSFPFAPVPLTDPVTGRSGDTLERLREQDAVPKIFFVQTATEYWARAASLLHTDVVGENDLAPDPEVRIYHIAGAQHLGATPTDPGLCQYPRSPLRHRPLVLRALLVAMDRWVSQGAAPPPSRHPRIGDKTLVNLEVFARQFPKIPGVALPNAYFQPLRLDLGPLWSDEGIATIVPPGIGPAYKTLIPAVDADGNELAGIRLPDVEVPLATYMGWNLRAEEYGVGGALADLHGAYLEFPKSASERRAADDPRTSVRERYPTREVYLAKYTDAVLRLQEDGFLLPKDAVALLKEAAARDFWSE